MSPLHKAPRGLLELLRLRTLGEQPNKFADVVTPNIDARPFYAADLLISDASAAAVGSITAGNGLVADASPLQDPQHLISLGGVLTMGVAPGTFFEWWIQLNLPSLARPAAIMANGRVSLNAATAAGDLMPFGFTFPQVIVVPAGAYYRVGVHGDGGGADHSLTARYLVANLSAQ